MSLMHATQATTSNAADLLGHSDLIASIEPGRSADMVAGDTSPATISRLLGACERFHLNSLRCYPQAVTPIEGPFVKD